MSRNEATNLLTDLLGGDQNITDTAAAFTAAGVAPIGQPQSVTVLSLLQQYAARFLNTDQVLIALGF